MTPILIASSLALDAAYWALVLLFRHRLPQWLTAPLPALWCLLSRAVTRHTNGGTR
jgi:hypothetical protein